MKVITEKDINSMSYTEQILLIHMNADNYSLINEPSLRVKKAFLYFYPFHGIKFDFIEEDIQFEMIKNNIKNISYICNPTEKVKEYVLNLDVELITYISNQSHDDHDIVISKIFENPDSYSYLVYHFYNLSIANFDKLIDFAKTELLFDNALEKTFAERYYVRSDDDSFKIYLALKYGIN